MGFVPHAVSVVRHHDVHRLCEMEGESVFEVAYFLRQCGVNGRLKRKMCRALYLMLFVAHNVTVVSGRV